MIPLGSLFLVCLLVAVVETLRGNPGDLWWGVGGTGILLLVAVIFKAGKTGAIIYGSRKHHQAPE